MEQERWARVDRLFHSALALPPGQRRAFLESECGTDQALIDEIESLIRADSDGASQSYEQWAHHAAAEWASTSSLRAGEAPGAGDPGLIGTAIGHYTIQRQLGAGGMGEVYLARDAKLGRLVALKTLPRAVADHPRRLERFMTEARAASALNHPNVASIHALGERDGLHFLVMEYIEGRSLADLTRDGPLPLDRALDIVLQIARALEEAHRHGITHRDIKPANVMVTPRGAVKVLDFGLAKLTHGGLGDPDRLAPGDVAPAVTLPGLVVGTVHYMSPEQALGQPVDPRSDLFSLGVLTYQVLTGTLPFDGPSFTATIDALLHREPVPASTRRPDLPAAADRVLARALAKSPDARYADAATFAADIEALRRQESPPGAPPVAPLERTSRGPRLFARSPALGVSALVAAALIVVAAAALALRAWRAAAAPPPVVLPVTSFAGTETTPAFAPAGDAIVYAWDGPGRDNLDIYIQPLGGAPVRLTTDPAPDAFPAISPDGQLVAFVRERTRLFVVPRSGGAERDLGPVADPRIGFTADSRAIGASAATSAGTATAPGSASSAGIVLVPIDGGARRPLTTPPPGGIDIAPAFSHDGRALAFQRIAMAVAADVWVAQADGRNARRLTFDDRSLEGPVWTADSRSLVYWSARRGAGRLWRISAAGGTPEPLPDTGPGATMPTIPKSGGKLAFVGTLEDTNIWEMGLDQAGRATPATPRLTPSASTWLDGSPDVSPDGRWLAFSSNRSGRDEIWIGELDGVAARQITNFADMPTSTVGTPRWSPDGTRLVFDANVRGNPDIYIVSAAGGPLTRVTSAPGADVVPAWSPDGAWIYFSSRRAGRPQVWRVPASGGRETPVTEGPAGGFAAQFSSDGASLIYSRDRVNSSLWQHPIAGGAETPLLVDETGRPRLVTQFACWRPTRTGVVFLETMNPEAPPAARRYVLQSFDAATRRVTTLHTLTAPPTMAAGGIALSPDGRRLFFSQVDAQRSDIFLLQPFQ